MAVEFSISKMGGGEILDQAKTVHSSRAQCPKKLFLCRIIAYLLRRYKLLIGVVIACNISAKPIHFDIILLLLTDLKAKNQNLWAKMGPTHSMELSPS
jgi:hypothetical protein